MMFLKNASQELRNCSCGKTLSSSRIFITHFVHFIPFASPHPKPRSEQVPQPCRSRWGVKEEFPHLIKVLFHQNKENPFQIYIFHPKNRREILQITLPLSLYSLQTPYGTGNFEWGNTNLGKVTTNKNATKLPKLGRHRTQKPT